MKISVRSLVCGAGLAFLGLCAVLQLTSPLGFTSEGDMYRGLEAMAAARSDVIRVLEDDAIDFFSALCIVQCLAGTAAILLGVCAVFSRGAAVAGIVLSALSLLLTAGYAVFGLANAIAGNQSVSQWHQPVGTGPFLLWFLLAVVAAVLVLVARETCSDSPLFAPQDGAPAEAASQTAEPALPLTEEQLARALRLCADMKDAGMLSEEEYAETKARLLGGKEADA